MSTRSARISTAIDSLVRRFQVVIPGEDPADAEERETNAVEFVREILKRYWPWKTCALSLNADLAI